MKSIAEPYIPNLKYVYSTTSSDIVQATEISY